MSELEQSMILATMRNVITLGKQQGMNEARQKELDALAQQWVDSNKRMCTIIRGNINELREYFSK